MTKHNNNNNRLPFMEYDPKPTIKRDRWPLVGWAALRVLLGSTGWPCVCLLLCAAFNDDWTRRHGPRIDKFLPREPWTWTEQASVWTSVVLCGVSTTCQIVLLVCLK